MSGTQVSPYGSADFNSLYNTAALSNLAVQKNQLAMQEAQQQLAGNEAEYSARAAQGILSIPDPAQRAAAWPGAVAALQRLGMAKNAPAQYPGDAVMQRVVQMGMPIKEQYEYGLTAPPAGLLERLGVTQPTPSSAPATPATPPSVPAYGGRGSPTMPAAYEPYFQQASKTYGVPVELLKAQAAQESGYRPDAVGPGGSIGIMQIQPATAASPGYGIAGSYSPDALKDPQTNIMLGAAYLAARAKAIGADLNTPAGQAAALRAYNGGGDPLYAEHVFSRMAGAPPAAAPGTFQFAAGGPGMPPTAAAGGPAPSLPAPVRVAGPGVPTPTTGTPAAGAQPPAPAPLSGPAAIQLATDAATKSGNYTRIPIPGSTDVVGPDGLPVPASSLPAGTRIDDAPTPPAPAPAPTAAPAPAPQQQTAAAPAPGTGPSGTTPAYTANLPHFWEVPSGVNSPQWQQAQQMLAQANALETDAARPGYWGNVAKLKMAQLQRDAAALQQMDVMVQTQEGQYNTRTGQMADPAKPLADYHETSPGSGIWVGGPGTEPKFQPPGRLVVTPGGDVYRTTSGGAVLLKQTDPEAVKAIEAAKASGAQIGAQVAKQVTQLADQGRNAAQAIGNIDYGMSQIQQAKEGGITTGYFAPWLATVAAIGKSLGGDVGERIATLGADPSAVGNIQTARKTLAVVSAAILQQALGQAQITDAKIEHFIHAQPGIETDPDALGRVLRWARSQFVYEREMAQAGMAEAAKSPTGTLPLNWEPNYYATHGFAPIYNPGTGEMQQPDGSTPPREPPAAAKPPPVAPINPAARTPGNTYMTPKGPKKWTGTGWLPPTE